MWRRAGAEVPPVSASLRRRIDSPGEPAPRWIRFAPVLAVVGPGVVALLVILKP